MLHFCHISKLEMAKRTFSETKVRYRINMSDVIMASNGHKYGDFLSSNSNFSGSAAAAASLTFGDLRRPLARSAVVTFID